MPLRSETVSEHIPRTAATAITAEKAPASVILMGIVIKFTRKNPTPSQPRKLT